MRLEQQSKRGKGAKILLIVILMVVCLIVGFFGGGLYQVLTITSRSDSSLINSQVVTKSKLLSEYIDRFYLDEVDEEAVQDYIYRGMIAGLGDPYSVYYTEEEYSQLMESLEGSYCGIGVLCTQDVETGEVIVLNPFKKGAAYEAGIRAGDRIRKVDGESVVGEDLNSIVAKIKGEEGTTVTVTVYQQATEEEKDFTLERRETENETVTYELLSDKIGYIEVSEFDEVTSDQFEEALKELVARFMQLF